MRSFFGKRAKPAATRSIVIHAEGSWCESIQARKFDFFNKLTEFATSQGVSTRIVEAGGPTSQVLLNPDHINIMVGDLPGQGLGQIHALPSYIWGFWYFDPSGVHWNSSLYNARFRPNQIDQEAAAYFFNGVSGYMLRENVSKFPQEPLLATKPQAAGAVIYCQDIEGRETKCHYLTTEQMIRVTATTLADEKVYVKPYPMQSKAMRSAVLDIAARYQNVTVSDASVHDLTAVSRSVVTQNSAAGFESLMHRKCVITCAKSDFWQATLTPRGEDDLADALRYGPEEMAEFPFDKFLYWFLDQNCLEPAKDGFVERAWGRIADRVFV